MSWEEARIGDVCQILNGGTPKTGVPQYWDGDIAWITPKDMGRLDDIYVTKTERRISASGMQNSSAKLLPPGSIILSTRAPIGHLAINEVPMTTNQGCKGLVLNGKANNKYLYYYLEANVKLLDSLGSGTTFKELAGSKLADVPLPLPPIPEQQRIVGKLDAAFAALAEAQAHAERNRANARELFESYLNGVFEGKGDGWVEKTLGEVARIRTGKVDANHQKVDGAYPFYTCAFGQFMSPTWSFEGPSVILPGNGANVGVAFYYDGRFEAYQRTYVVNEFNSLLNPRFAYYSFRAAWKIYIATRQFGSATNYIVLGDLKLFPIALPDIREQEKLVLEFEMAENLMNELETTYQQKLAELAGLKKAVLGAAFRGEL